MKAWSLLLLPALVGCPRSAPAPVAADWDPDALVEAAQSREVPPVVRGSFRMKIEGVDTAIPGGLEGVLILGPGGAFYTEVASTFGPRVMTCASDGQSLALLIPRERLWAGEEGGARGMGRGGRGAGEGEGEKKCYFKLRPYLAVGSTEEQCLRQDKGRDC